jgi:hypothetical protein
MKKKICISLVVYNEEYVSSFINNNLKILVNSLNALCNEYEIVIFISVKNQIEKQLLKKAFSDNFTLEFFYTNRLFFNNYRNVTKEQINHIQKAKFENYDYLFFYYADFIINKNGFINSLREIKEKKVLNTFGLLLNKNEELDIFKNHLQKDTPDKIIFLIKNIKKLVSNFHWQFHINSFVGNPSFIWYSTNKYIFIKAKHNHPFLFNLKKFDNSDFDKVKCITIDNNFINQINVKIDEVITFKDYNELSLFSIESPNSKRNLKAKNFLNIKQNTFKQNKLSREIQILNFLRYSREHYNKKDLEAMIAIKYTISNVKFSKPVNSFDEYFIKTSKNQTRILNEIRSVLVSKLIEEKISLFYLCLQTIFFIISRFPVFGIANLNINYLFFKEYFLKKSSNSIKKQKKLFLFKILHSLFSVNKFFIFSLIIYFTKIKFK